MRIPAAGLATTVAFQMILWSLVTKYIPYYAPHPVPLNTIRVLVSSRSPHALGDGALQLQRLRLAAMPSTILVCLPSSPIFV